MTPKIESATYVSRYTIHVRFADGVEGDVNLEDELWGKVFEPLKEPAVFREFLLDTELNTLTWSCGADLANVPARVSQRDPRPPEQRIERGPCGFEFFRALAIRVRAATRIAVRRPGANVACGLHLLEKRA